jgi:MFS family permease
MGLRPYIVFILVMVVIGILDAVALYRASSYFRADPMYLGIISFFWSLFYISFSIFFGYLGDRYRIRVLGIISATLLTISSIYILFSQDLLWLLIGYSLHALATSSGRIVVSIDLLENSDRDVWEELNFLLRGVFWILRALLIYLIIETGYYVEISIVITILASILLSTVPEILLLSRRFLYRIGDLLDRYYGIASLRGLAISSIVDISSRYPRIDMMWNMRSANPALLAVSSALLTASAEMILTPAPSILESNLGPQGVSQYMVLSALLTGILMLITWMAQKTLNLWYFWSLAAATPPLMFAIGFIEIHGQAIIYILTLYMVSYNMLEVGNFNSYSNITSGYGVGEYQAIREIGGLLGGLVSGYVATYTGYLASIYIGITLLLLSILTKILSTTGSKHIFD